MSGGRENQNSPTFEDIISTLFRRFACEEIQTAHPGKIVEYNHKTQEADVELQVIRNYIDGSFLKLPIVTSVPVMQYRTSAAMIKLPVNIGDRVLVLYSKSSLDAYLATGSESTYSSGKQFLLSDGIAIPGLFPFSEPNNTGNERDLEIINNDQKITIKENGDIEIGADSLKKIVTEDIISAFNSHTHTGITVGAGVSGVPSVPLNETILTTKTKAE